MRHVLMETKKNREGIKGPASEWRNAKARGRADTAEGEKEESKRGPFRTEGGGHVVARTRYENAEMLRSISKLRGEGLGVTFLRGSSGGYFCQTYNARSRVRPSTRKGNDLGEK